LLLDDVLAALEKVFTFFFPRQHTDLLAAFTPLNGLLKNVLAEI
jgi:hypothetical protein